MGARELGILNEVIDITNHLHGVGDTMTEAEAMDINSRLDTLAAQVARLQTPWWMKLIQGFGILALVGALLSIGGYRKTIDSIDETVKTLATKESVAEIKTTMQTKEIAELQYKMLNEKLDRALAK